jgi:hypothetical protein
MSDQPEILTHPVFGELRWESERSVWFTQIRDSAGEWIDVSVEADEGDRVACLDRAADLYSRAMGAERQLLCTAVEQELLPLYNDCWRESLWPVMTAKQLMEHLEFTFIQIRPGSDIAVILSYTAEHLFADRCVDVELDDELRLRKVGLVG